MRLRLVSLVMLGVLSPALASAETETLEQAWAQVYQSNPSLLAARAELRSVDEHVSQALSHWRPNIDVTSSVGKTYQYIPGQEQYGTAEFAGTTRSAGIQLTQPLFRGFRTQAETEAADQQVLAARAKLNDIEQQLFLDTATAYLDVMRDMALLDAAKQNEKVLQEKLDETQERSKIGELSTTDTHQAESRLARAHVSRLQDETSLTKSRVSYMRLVGHMPEQLITPSMTVDKNLGLGEIIHIAETNNPNVIAANHSIDEAKARIDLNKGALLPELNLVGNSGRSWAQNSSVPGREDSSQIMLQLTVPLYHAGTDYSHTREAEQTATQRRMELEEARKKAREAAHNAWQILEASQEALLADDEEIKASSLALEGVKAEANIGTRTTLDILNAEQELLDARIDQAKSQHDKNLAILQIKMAIGTLTAEELNLSTEHYDPERHYKDVRGQWLGFSQDNTRYDLSPSDNGLQQ